MIVIIINTEQSLKWSTAQGDVRYVQDTSQIRANYKEPTDGNFDDCCTSEILRNLAAEDNSDSESDACSERQLMDKLKQKFLNVKLRYFGITVIKQQFEFYYQLTLYSFKFRGFNPRVSYISGVLNY